MQNLKPFLATITKTDTATTVAASVMMTVCTLAMFLTWGMLAAAAALNPLSQNTIISPQLQNSTDENTLPLDLTSIPEDAYAPGELLVRFKGHPQVSNQKITKFASVNTLNIKHKVKKYSPLLKAKKDDAVYKLKLEKGMNVLDAAADFNQDPNVLRAEPNFLRQLTLVPGDSRYPEQWAHQETQAELGWEITQGDPGVVIAVIDSGVDFSHPDLSENMLGDCTNGCPAGTGYDFVDIDTQSYLDRGYKLIDSEDYTLPDTVPLDIDGHGTHVAGIAAARGNTIGVSGVCRYCKIMPVRAGFVITRPDTFEAGLLTTDAIVNAIYYATDNGAKIINMSFGGGFAAAEEQQALRYAHERGVVLVAAAGNDGSDVEFYPAALENVIAVTATGFFDRKAPFSTHGFWTDVAAPGEAILSTYTTRGPFAEPAGYRVLSGTSMAAPYISGVVGLILSHHPAFGPEQIDAVIEQGVDIPNETSAYIGSGRINIFRTLQIQSFSNSSAAVTYPANGEIFILRGNNPIPIRGEMAGESYHIDYGIGIYPKIWTDVASGVITENPFARDLPISNITDNTYTLRLTTRDAAGENFARKTFYTLDGSTIEDQWPYQCQGCSGRGFRAPILYDTTRDGLDEIIVGFSDGRLFAFSHGGLPVSEEWPVSSLYIDAFDEPVAVGDLEKDGVPDIVVTDWNRINKLDPRGRNVASFSYNDPLISYSDKKLGTPVLADVNDDNNLDILVATQGGSILFLNHNLELLREALKLGESITQPAVGDVDNDGIKEIVVAASGGNNPFPQMYVLNALGENKNGWPRPLQYSGSIFSDEVPILLNFDNDIELEIVFASHGFNVWNHDGSDFLRGIYLPTLRLAVAGDLDRDGRIEIIGQDFSSELIVVKNGGSWKAINSNVEKLSGISLANLDTDQSLEIVGLTKSGKLHIWNNNGTIAGYPKTIGTRSGSYPAIGDIDNDGRLEIVAGADNLLYAFDVKIPHGSRDVEWGMFQYDPQHTGCFQCERQACGNGIVEGDEVCDGVNVGGQTCVTRGFDAGELSCTDSCTYDIRQCVEYGCGNGRIDPGETCDDGNVVAGDGCSGTCQREWFRRSDANASGGVDIADPILTFSWLFSGGAEPPCQDAADSNDDGLIDISDGIYTLNYLFTGQNPPPPDPGPQTPGPDPTEDALGCGAYPGP